MKKFLVNLIVAALAIVSVILVVNTFRYGSEDKPESHQALNSLEFPLNPDSLAQRLSQAVRIATVSHADPTLVNRSAFDSLGSWIEKQFPLIHQELKYESVNRWSRLYYWPGANLQLAPVLLLAHLDVVPADTATIAEWQHPPFSGRIDDGYIWGRGTLDDKASAVAILTAVESLMKMGYQPQRSIYLAFGADEEVGGDGAIAMAKKLADRKVTAEFVLDEGMAVVSGVLPFTDAPVGLIGVAEKGYLSLKLTARAQGGHSSQPPSETATAALAKALTLLDNAPLPATTKYMSGMFEAFADQMSIAERFLFANQWLTEPLIISQLEKTPATNASIRSTTAITMLSASPKDNVLAATATAVVNFRLLPGNSVKSVIQHVEKAIGDDRIKVTVFGAASEASAVSSSDSEALQLIEMAATRSLGESLQFVPTMVLGATDSRHYAAVAKNTYRFVPLRLNAGDLSRVHGINERISVRNFAEIVRFYAILLQNV